MKTESIRLVYAGESTLRLDKFLAEQIRQLSRAKLQEMISNGEVQINGKVVTKAAQKLEHGDHVETVLVFEEEDELKKQALVLDVLYEDENVIVLNKPAGLVVHPGAGHNKNTLVNALIYHWPEIAQVGEPKRPGIVHRLDKETSGVMIAARNQAAYEWLVKQFKGRKVQKSYLALVDGTPPTPTGRIETRIGRDEKIRQRMAVTYGEKGRKAVTEYFTKKDYLDHTLVEVNPLSGRTHQIRVHMAFIGCPVAGDRVYGRRKSSLEIDRFFLHASGLNVRLPGEKEKHSFEAPLPQDLQEILEQLESK
jgi:23S rRNA pseudouridine1911/1915/1917 synthase